MLTHDEVHMEEINRDYRTETPNIVHDLVELGRLSHWARTLYGVYRRIAGETGKCWAYIKNLVKKCGFQRTKLMEAKKELITPFPELNGKTLVKIKPGNKVKNEADIVTITDIWPENHSYFKNKLTSSAIRTTPRPQYEPPPSAIRTTSIKKEPCKKEPCKKIIIATPDPKPEKPVPEKTVPAGGNNKFHKCLEKCEDLSDRQKIQISQHPEDLVEKAVKYLYHPSVEHKGGPVGRMKRFSHFFKDPEAYAETLTNLDKPKELTFKEKILSRFEKGKIYNHYIFDYDERAYTFTVDTTGFQTRFEWRDPDIEEKMRLFSARFKR